MQLLAEVTNVKYFVFFIPLLGLIGCSDVQKTKPSTSAPMSKVALIEKDPAGRYYKDAVAKFAIGNVPGSAGPVQLNSKKSYQVSVGSDYVAVTGEACRNVILVPLSGAATKSSVCRVKGVWRTITLP